MIKDLSSRFRKAPVTDGEPSSAAAASDPENAIITLIVGSLSGASKRDVTAYMRGIAEAHILAKESCHLGLRRHRDRWLYEIHEGGPGLSVLDNVAARLDVEPEASLCYQLADGRTVEILESENDVISIIFPRNEDRPNGGKSNDENLDEGRPSIAVAPVFSKRKLTPYLGTGRALRMLGTVLLGFGFTALVAAGGAHVLASNLIDTDRLLRREAVDRALLNKADQLPIFEFERAKKSALVTGGYIHKIAFENGRWISSVLPRTQPAEAPPSLQNIENETQNPGAPE